MNYTYQLVVLMLVVVALCAQVHAQEPTVDQQEKRTALNSAILKIALIGDPHISTDPQLAEYVEHFKKVIADVNSAHVDVALLAGDLAQGAKSEWLMEFKTMAGQLQAPWWCVPGNHDVGDRPLPNKPSHAMEDHITQYEKILGPAWYVQEFRPDVRVVGFTSSLFGTGLPQEQRQWEFLKTELTRPFKGTTLLLTHYPLFVAKVDEPSEYFNLEPATRQELLKLMAANGADKKVIVSAHLHHPIDLEWQGIRMIGAPPVSFGIPKGKQRVGWTLISLGKDGQVRTEIRYVDAAPASQPGR